MLVAFLAIASTLILVVGLHEAGHAMAARFFRVRIKKIAIGFGKPLATWRGKGGCEWIWALWPLGGYVHLLNSRITPVAPEEYPLCFDKKPVWVRIIILLAGCVVNWATAWFILVLVFCLGLPHQVPQVETVQPHSVAAAAGIVPGDQWVSIAGKQVYSWQDVGMELMIAWGKSDIPISVRTAKGGVLKRTTLDLSHIQLFTIKKNLLAAIGMAANKSSPQKIRSFSSLAGAMSQASQVMYHTVYFFMVVLKQLIMGVIPFSLLLGPLGLFAASITSFTHGFIVFLLFIAHLSLAVALVNLFPIPGLDGGGILYAVLEKIRGKPISIAAEVLVYRLVLISGCVILVHLIMNDLNRLV